MTKLTSIIGAIALCFLGLSATAQYTYLGSWNGKGVPNYLENPGDEIDVQMLEDINLSLPERKPVPDYHPEYLTAVNEYDILLDSLADVYVTFVHEGAGWKNSLAFYSYDRANPPTHPDSIADLTLVFPNFSYQGSGGGMQSGDKVHLGQFPANTGIGFALVTRGWQRTTQSVVNNYYTVYSNPDFNPETVDSLQQHVVALADADRELVLYGFEDINRQWGSCDQDFNDAIYYVTATPFEAIDIENMGVVANATVNCNSVPENLTATEVKMYESTLIWESAPNADEYRIRFREWGTDDAWQYRNAGADTSITLGSIQYDDLEPGTYYEWQVAVTCTAVQTSNSVLHVFQTIPDCDMPTGYSATNITSSGARVSWNSSANATTYLLRYFKDGDASFEWRNTQGNNYFDITDLEPNTEYFWSVGSRCDEFQSCMAPYSAHYSFTTLEEGRIAEEVVEECNNKSNYLIFNNVEQINSLQANNKTIISEDMNGDGVLDLVVGYPETHEFVTLLLGNPNVATGYLNPVHLPTDFTYTSVSIASLNTDQKKDFILTNSMDNRVKLYTYEGGSNLTLQSSIATDMFPSHCIGADLDMDGLSELILANSATDKIHLLTRYVAEDNLYREDPGMLFQEFKNYNTGESPTMLFAEDIDKNGKIDIGSINELSNSFALIYNGEEVDSTYHIKSVFEPGAKPMDLAFGDINGDGLTDAITATQDQQLAIYKNIGHVQNMVFDEPVFFSLPATPIALAVDQLSGDDKADIIVAFENSDNIALIQSVGSNSIQLSSTIMLSADENVLDIEIADANGDGKNDLILALEGGLIEVAKNGISGNGPHVELQKVKSGIGHQFIAEPSFAAQNYQWQVGNGKNFTDLQESLAVAGVNTSTLTVAKHSSIGGKKVRCVVTDRECRKEYVSDYEKINVDITYGEPSVYPNPTESQIIVQFDNPELNSADIRIMSASGNLVKFRTIQHAAGTLDETFSLNELAEGIYFVRVTTNIGTQTYRIVKR